MLASTLGLLSMGLLKRRRSRGWFFLSDTGGFVAKSV